MHLHRKTIKQENVTTEATTTKNILDDLVDPFYLPLDEIVKHHVFETNSCYLSISLLKRKSKFEISIAICNYQKSLTFSVSLFTVVSPSVLNAITILVSLYFS